MGIDAARTLGSHHRAGAGLHLAVQYSVRDSRRRLHPMGLAARTVARGIRRHGRRPRRITEPTNPVFVLGITRLDRRSRPFGRGTYKHAAPALGIEWNSCLFELRPILIPACVRNVSSHFT